MSRIEGGVVPLIDDGYQIIIPFATDSKENESYGKEKKTSFHH